MKIIKQYGRRAFTLIEMIGVIAIISILATVLLPKVQSAIARSKVSSTVLVFNTLKTVVVDYYSRSNTFPLRACPGFQHR